MNKYDIYITFIIIIKVLFLILTIVHAFLKAKNKENSILNKKIVYWKERLEFVFILSMSLLLIFIFNPRKDRSKYLDYETKILFYLFGFILIITAKWEIILPNI